MTPISTILITPSAAADAYKQIAAGGTKETTQSFGSTMEQVLSQAEQTGYKADDQAVKAISGTGNLTEVVTALSHAEMTLQTVTAIRDRVVQAYQDIMKMPI
jgi:flagellar hook-basal body complex protein FliE